MCQQEPAALRAFLFLKVRYMKLLRYCFANLMLLASLYLFLSGQSLAVAENAKFTQVVVPNITSSDINHEDYYFSQLLRLALTKTQATHGRFEIQSSAFYTADARLRVAMKKGEVDVIWSTTSPEFEREMLPVKISLLKELNNYRVLIIRAGDQEIFSAVQTLDDLRKLRGGMNPQWADSVIMKKNNLPQVYAVGYGKLFKMLAAKRFDYFSRGLYQVQSEVKFYPHLPLVIEQELLLHYDNQFYFFLNKSNTALAERIQTGLELAIKDGSFDELFNSVPRYRWAMDELTSDRRRVLDLKGF